MVSSAIRLGAIGLVLFGASACGGTEAVSDAGVGDSGPLVGSPTRGMTIATTSGCAAVAVCHGSDLGGLVTPVPGTMVYPRNITPDTATGIGSFTDEEIALAVRTGVTRGGRTLCPNMTRFPMMTDQQVADLVAYLHTVPAVSRVVPASRCK